MEAAEAECMNTLHELLEKKKYSSNMTLGCNGYLVHPFSKESVGTLELSRGDPSFPAFFQGSRSQQESLDRPDHHGFSVCSPNAIRLCPGVATGLHPLYRHVSVRLCWLLTSDPDQEENTTRVLLTEAHSFSKRPFYSRFSPMRSVFSRLLTKLSQPAGRPWLSRSRGHFHLLPKYHPLCVQA
jgi:hypothetical protein